MSKFWLKMIGTTERRCPEHYTREWADSRRRMRRIQVGDHMVLYAVGAGKRVFALARVTEAVHDSGNPDWPYRVTISYLVNLPVSSGVSVDKISTERDLIRPIQRGASYVELSSEEYERAAALLQAAAGNTEGAPSQAAQM
jgi:hypothetical protein